MTPDVSVILPCRNEARFIGRCLESLRVQHLPGKALEILVVDGMSTDGTRAAVARMALRDPRIRLLDNPRRVVPTALNLGLRRATAPVIVRMDVHCNYPSGYIAACLLALEKSGADNVGGVVHTLPRGAGLEAETVAALSSHRFGVGDARFRVGSRAGDADTVPFGCYPKRTFERFGLFDERLVRNQDYEFNARLRAAGGRVWLDPTIQAEYFNQPHLRGLLRQAAVTGRWNAYTWHVAPYTIRPRHAVPAIFVAALALGALLAPFLATVYALLLTVSALYLALAAASACQQAARFHDPRLCLTLPPAFLAYHLSYGYGTIVGLLQLALRRAPPELSGLPYDGAPTARLHPASPHGEGRSAFDLLVSSLALLVLSPLLAVVAVLVKLERRGPILFAQTRCGYLGRPFTIYKFRTMVSGAERMGSSVTTASDSRITPLGRLLRRTKLDELPQLWNVVRGDMSLVGPRPDVPEVVDGYTDEMRKILNVPPGITSLASLELVDEEQLLAEVPDPERFYREVLVPAKIRYAMVHVDDRSLRLELSTLWRTAVASARRALGLANQGSLARSLREVVLTAAELASVSGEE